MLLSFNKCSISALTAPIYQSIEEMPQEKTRKSNLNFCVKFTVCHRSFVGLYVYGAITFAHIFQKFRLRTFFICAQKCISFAHSLSVTFAHMFLHLFLSQLVFYYIKVR